MNRAENVKAFVVHQRQYRETSSIVEFFTEHGLLSAVCRGVYGSGKAAGRLRGTLQPFGELSLSWFGRGELKTVRQVETISTAPNLSYSVLYSGLYLNELLLRLAPSSEHENGLYLLYKNTLQDLAALASDSADINSSVEAILRRFEIQLLEDLGFAIDFQREWGEHTPINEELHYSFDSGHGFTRCCAEAAGNRLRSIPGWVIMRIREADFSDARVRRYAKQVVREALAPHLGDRPLQTRELYS